MPDPLKSAGQDMQQEAANKLIDIQAHHLLARVVAVILPVKADLAIDAIDQTMIGNSDIAIHRTSEYCTQIIPSFYRWDNIQNFISSFRILNKLTNFAAEPPHLYVELIISQTNKKLLNS